VTVPFLLAVADVSVHCESKSSINSAGFMWENACIFAFKMCAIVCVPLDTPTIFYLHHHGATSGGWTPDSLCKGCLEEFQPILRPFIGNCTDTRSCRCNVCLRQAPSLRSLASYTVFHLTLHLSEFKLTRRTLYHQYVYAVKSNIVPVDRLIPRTFPQLQCNFVRYNPCDIRKRFHKACIMPSGRYWSTYYGNTMQLEKRQSQHSVTTKIYGGVIFVLDLYSQLQNVCSVNSIWRLFRTT